jgi:hypothetical protein
MMESTRSYYDAEFGQIILEDNYWTSIAQVSNTARLRENRWWNKEYFVRV